MSTIAIDVLNTLIEINNDRIEGYRKAAEETKAPDLKKMFLAFQQNSQRFKADLVREVQNLGGDVKESTSTSGQFYRAWQDIKAALKGNDRLTILDSCEYAEDVASGAYKELINGNWEKLSVSQQVLLNRHYESLKTDRDNIKLMLNELLEHH